MRNVSFNVYISLTLILAFVLFLTCSTFAQKIIFPDTKILSTPSEKASIVLRASNPKQPNKSKNNGRHVESEEEDETGEQTDDDTDSGRESMEENCRCVPKEDCMIGEDDDGNDGSSEDENDGSGLLDPRNLTKNNSTSVRQDSFNRGRKTNSRGVRKSSSRGIRRRRKFKIVNRPPGGVEECPINEKYCCEETEEIFQCGRQRISPNSNHPDYAYAEAKYGAWPWHVALFNSSGFLGSGALIDSRYVLTAAHIIPTNINSNTFRSITVRLGEWDIKSASEPFPVLSIPVSNVVMHSGFNAANLQNDIALITLARPVNLKTNLHINRVCLPTERENFIGKTCFVAGFGRTDFDGNYSNTLRQVDLTILRNNICEESLRATRLGRNFVFNTKSFICSGGEEGKDACTGDGGSPLVCKNRDGRYTVAGLVSWGIGCANYRIPGVYVNVPNYRRWITGQIDKSSAKTLSIK